MCDICAHAPARSALQMMKDSLEWRSEHHVSTILDSNIAGKRPFIAGCERQGQLLSLFPSQTSPWRSSSRKGRPSTRATIGRCAPSSKSSKELGQLTESVHVRRLTPALNCPGIAENA